MDNQWKKDTDAQRENFAQGNGEARSYRVRSQLQDDCY